jgi:hypothetical protein
MDLLLSQWMTDEVHVTGEATCAGTFIRSPTPYPDEYGKGIKVTGSNPNKSYDWFHRRLPNYSSVAPIQTDNLSPDSGAFNNGFVIENHYDDHSAYYVVLSNSGDGQVKIYGKEGSGWDYLGTEYIENIKSSSKGVLKSSEPIYVKGTVENQLTIVSERDIYIDGDIVLDGITPGEMPELTNPDMLGLVAGEDVLISKRFLRQSGDLYVHAAMFAKDGRVVPEGYDYHNPSYNTWENNGRNELHLIGSTLVDRQCGTYSFYNGSYGFRMHNWGDPRFMQNIATPPGLPDVREKDNEMRDHWNVTLAMSFPITVTSWSNTIQ